MIDRRAVAPRIRPAAGRHFSECDEVAPGVFNERHTRLSRDGEDLSLRNATSKSENARTAVAARTELHDPLMVTAGDPFTSTYPSKRAIQGMAIVTLFANA